ncbi:hypothetical protein [Burkholderia sp. Bp8986]|uniref:hypothetical protein n=1 Tax=Burkholderia sp. Bp8986 TaxID=2184550 RepID=UPI000F592686|nr:hypothetical protein [Burkholderia sp. Bp8986]RQS60389.1 hypothetical protein DID99_01715 [Burkholderia sp. Bp8986]
MATSTAFSDLGYRLDDGDIGYLGDSHISFTPRPTPRVSDIKPTSTGSAACAALVDLVHHRFPAAHESRSERNAVTPERYWAAISRIGRGFA